MLHKSLQIVVSENGIASKPLHQAYFKMHLHSTAKPYRSKTTQPGCYAHSPQYLSLSYSNVNVFLENITVKLTYLLQR